jgi:ABC-type polysaccharide/polyol phosphate transport system ATPase subunit
MSYQYQVVPFRGTIKGNQSSDDVAKQIESTINQYAAQGWEFCQLTDVNIEVQPGCLAGLLGTKASYMRYDQIIFRKSA